MGSYENDNFIENDNNACGQNYCHCADEAIKPFEIPTRNIILWDHQPYGPAQIVHLSQYRKPMIRILNKVIGTGSGMVTKKGAVNLTAAGVLSYNTDSLDGGLHILLDKVQENCSESSLQNAQFTAHVVFAKDMNMPTTKEEEYYSDLKSVSEQCCSTLPIDPSKFIKVRLKCLTKGLSCQIMVEMISLAIKFIATPLSPIPTVMTALSNRLSSLSSRKERQTGFIVMDKFRKLVLLLENDPKVLEFPIVGLWVSGVPSVIHPFVWFSFLRYISCAEYSNRLCFPPQPFLLALYSSACELPEYYDCITSDGSQNLSYDLYFGCGVASVSRFPLFDVSTTDIELSRAADKRKCRYFASAESQLLNNKQQPHRIPSVICSNTDDMPQISPVPQSVKMVTSHPLVPDLSLVTSRNSYSNSLFMIEDKSITCCNNCEDDNNETIKEFGCHIASLYNRPTSPNSIGLSFASNHFAKSDEVDGYGFKKCVKSWHFNNCKGNDTEQVLKEPRCCTGNLCKESIHSDSEDLPLLPLCVGEYDQFKEKTVSVKDNVATHYNSHTAYSGGNHKGLSEDDQPTDKENSMLLISNAELKLLTQNFVPRNKNNSKITATQRTRIPKLRHRPNEKYPMPKHNPILSSYHRPPDLQKTVLQASASTMTSFVWPPADVSQEAEENREKIYVDEVLQTDELNFKCHEPNAEVLSRTVVECVATQTSICTQGTTDCEGYHHTGCCKCIINKCSKRSLLCNCHQYGDGNKLQCHVLGINSSEDTFFDMFSSECNINEDDDNLALGESASTIANKAKQNFHKIPVIDRKHKDKWKKEHSVGNSASINDEEDEVVRLYNLIQDCVPNVPSERPINKVEDMSGVPKILFHSTSETTRQLNSFAFKYVEPEVLSDFVRSHRLDSVDGHMTDNYKIFNPYETVRIQTEDEDFNPSSHNVLASQFSVATNRHLERYLFS